MIPQQVQCKIFTKSKHGKKVAVVEKFMNELKKKIQSTSNRVGVILAPWYHSKRR